MHSGLVVPLTIQEELSIVFSLLEELAKDTFKFPKADEKNIIVTHVYNEIVLATCMLSNYTHAATPEPIVIEPPPARPESTMSRRSFLSRKSRASTTPVIQKPTVLQPPSTWNLLLETMYRAARHSFRSRSVLRCLGTIALLLESPEEALCLFKVYLEKDKKDKFGEWWRRDDEEMDGESIEDVVSVHLAASHTAITLHQVCINYFKAFNSI